MADSKPSHWHVIVEQGEEVFPEEFSGSMHAKATRDSQHETPLGAYARQLELIGDGKGERVIVLSSPAYERYARRRKRLSLPLRKSSRQTRSNPRRSKVKDALALEALRYKKFSEFAERYWNDCARGIYWVATDNPDFRLTEREAAKAEKGRFTVACNPHFALKGKDEEKLFVAELNVNRLNPGNIAVKRGTNGAEIKLLDLRGVEVMRVVHSDKAKRAFRYQQGLLPSSKEQLKEFWEKAWDKEQKRVEKEREKEIRTRIKQEKKAEREQKARVKREKKAREERARQLRKVEKLRKKKTKKKSKKKTSKKKTSKKKSSTRRTRRRRNPESHDPIRLVPSHLNCPTG